MAATPTEVVISRTPVDKIIRQIKRAINAREKKETDNANKNQIGVLLLVFDFLARPCLVSDRLIKYLEEYPDYVPDNNNDIEQIINAALEVHRLSKEQYEELKLNRQIKKYPDAKKESTDDQTRHDKKNRLIKKLFQQIQGLRQSTGETRNSQIIGVLQGAIVYLNSEMNEGDKAEFDAVKDAFPLYQKDQEVLESILETDVIGSNLLADNGKPFDSSKFMIFTCPQQHEEPDEWAGKMLNEEGINLLKVGKKYIAFFPKFPPEYVNYYEALQQAIAKKIEAEEDRPCICLQLKGRNLRQRDALNVRATVGLAGGTGPLSDATALCNLFDKLSGTDHATPWDEKANTIGKAMQDFSGVLYSMPPPRSKSKAFKNMKRYLSLYADARRFLPCTSLHILTNTGHLNKGLFSKKLILGSEAYGKVCDMTERVVDKIADENNCANVLILGTLEAHNKKLYANLLKTRAPTLNYYLPTWEGDYEQGKDQVDFDPLKDEIKEYLPLDESEVGIELSNLILKDGDSPLEIPRPEIAEKKDSAREYLQLIIDKVKAGHVDTEMVGRDNIKRTWGAEFVRFVVEQFNPDCDTILFSCTELPMLLHTKDPENSKQTYFQTLKNEIAEKYKDNVNRLVRYYDTEAMFVDIIASRNDELTKPAFWAQRHDLIKARHEALLFRLENVLARLQSFGVGDKDIALEASIAAKSEEIKDELSNGNFEAARTLLDSVDDSAAKIEHNPCINALREVIEDLREEIATFKQKNSNIHSDIDWVDEDDEELYTHLEALNVRSADLLQQLSDATSNCASSLADSFSQLNKSVEKEDEELEDAPLGAHIESGSDSNDYLDNQLEALNAQSPDLSQQLSDAASNCASSITDSLSQLNRSDENKKNS
jgi:hypothetical protein